MCTQLVPLERNPQKFSYLNVVHPQMEKQTDRAYLKIKLLCCFKKEFQNAQSFYNRALNLESPSPTS